MEFGVRYPEIHSERFLSCHFVLFRGKNRLEPDESIITSAKTTV